MSRARLRLLRLAYAAIALGAFIAASSLLGWAAAREAPRGAVAALICLIGSAVALRAWDRTSSILEHHSDEA